MVVTTGELRLPLPLRRDAGAELERLYRGHSDEVLRYALSLLRSRSDAEDATQAVFIRALRALQRGERVRAPRNWLITIAHNECRRTLSARKPHAELPDQLPTEQEEAGRATELKRALEALPESQRHALVLRELEGRTYAEIAAALGVSLSAVETLIFRARRAVREQLEAAISCEEFASLLDDPAERPRVRAHARTCAACAHLERQARGRKSALRRIASALGLPCWGAKVAAVALTTATVAGGVAAGEPPARRQAPPRPPAAISHAIAPAVPHPRVASKPSVHPVVATPKQRTEAHAAARAAHHAPTRPPAAPPGHRSATLVSRPVAAARQAPVAEPPAPATRPAPSAPEPAPSAARPQPAPPAAAVPTAPAPPPPPPASAPAVPAPPVALPPPPAVPAPPPVALPPLPAPPAVPEAPAVPVSPALPPVSVPPPPPVAVPSVPVPAPPPVPPVSVPGALPSVSAP